LPGDLFIRTEDIKLDDVLLYLVATPTERGIIDRLKGRMPIILKGSRGVGKSFLLRAAEAELKASLPEERVLPVYVAFRKAGLITIRSPGGFFAWMISKICNDISRAASSAGLTLPSESIINTIRGGDPTSGMSRMEQVEAYFENSWKTPVDETAGYDAPDPDVVRDAIEDLCREVRLARVNLLVDEAAHVFIPEQQRQFFTLMRDLRSPYISVKAAVYPGATTFGDSFQLSHDATVVSIDRSIKDDGYLDAMRAIVVKQDASLARPIGQNEAAFNTLAYAASGNPRVLLKTIRGNKPFHRSHIRESIQKHYRDEIWADHSDLAERYPGHRALIDWGRQFIESGVLPELYSRNHKFPETSLYLWIHRDAPPAVRHAMQLLCYSGILQEDAVGVRGRKGVGTRYMVNLGCQLALSNDPIVYCTQVLSDLSVRRTLEYENDHSSYTPLNSFALGDIVHTGNAALRVRLRASSHLLDVTQFQRKKFAELNLLTIGDVLDADESVLMRAKQVGKIRARQMRNAALTAVMEYLSG
jgi:hypothetical protein